MLAATPFGVPTVNIYAPLGRAGRRGLGASDGDYTIGSVCGAGTDLVCNVKGWIYSCRPCDTPQLAVLKDLQDQVNRILKAKGLITSSLPFLDEDGRVGPKTAVAFAAAVKQAMGVATLPATLQVAAGVAGSQPGSQQAMQEIAKAAPTAQAYLRQVADMIGAPHEIPQGPQGPPSGATGPATLPDPGQVYLPPPKKGNAGVVVGALAGLTAIGLVGTAVYYKRKRRR